MRSSPMSAGGRRAQADERSSVLPRLHLPPLPAEATGCACAMIHACAMTRACATSHGCETKLACHPSGHCAGDSAGDGEPSDSEAQPLLAGLSPSFACRWPSCRLCRGGARSRGAATGSARTGPPPSSRVTCVPPGTTASGRTCRRCGRQWQGDRTHPSFSRLLLRTCAGGVVAFPSSSWWWPQRHAHRSPSPWGGRRGRGCLPVSGPQPAATRAGPPFVLVSWTSVPA
mmetsp:Transcript_40046/g.77945  ORF Transcript_40046/g.77945 Transcript_40046/m.77945 type:complete len:229 (+) Transcript_40046:2582-3268(+)